MLVKIYVFTTIKSIRPAEGMGKYVMTTEANGKEVTLTGEISFKENPSEKWDHEMASNKVANLIVTQSAIARLTNKCDALEVYTDCDWVAAAFNAGWLENWKNNDWLNALGNPVASAEEWKAVDAKLTELSIKPVIHLKEPHPFRKWFEMEEKLHG